MRRREREERHKATAARLVQCGCTMCYTDPNDNLLDFATRKQHITAYGIHPEVDRDVGDYYIEEKRAKRLIKAAEAEGSARREPKARKIQGAT